MQGTEIAGSVQLLDALGLCGALVREGSVPIGSSGRAIPPQVANGDGLFADLFGGRAGRRCRGRCIAVVMVLQALEGCSDLVEASCESVAL